MKPLFERSRRVGRGDTCIVVGFSFEKPRTIKNLTKMVRALRVAGPDHWVCKAETPGVELHGCDEEGCIILPEKWLLPINPSAGDIQQAKSPTPFQPAFA